MADSALIVIHDKKGGHVQIRLTWNRDEVYATTWGEDGDKSLSVLCRGDQLDIDGPENPCPCKHPMRI